MKPKRNKSPVRMVCFQPFKDYGDDMKVCRWTCPRGGATVQFRSRHRPEWFAILHPSTKQRGKWQVSSFDDRGAIGDVIRDSCEIALYDAGIGRDWKIEEIGREGLGRARRRR